MLFRVFLFLPLILSTVGCNGSGGGNDAPPPAQVETIHGGTASDPVAIEPIVNNQISSNAEQNYFKYTGVKGEMVVLFSTLNNPMSDAERESCASVHDQPGFYRTEIKITTPTHTIVGGTCGEDTIFKLPDDGTYIFIFDYGDDRSGVFNAAIVSDTSFNNRPNETTGTPNEPTIITAESGNSLSGRPFFSYFQYSLIAGEKIVIDAALSPELSSTQQSRCASDPGVYRTTQIRVYDSTYSQQEFVCGTHLEFIAPATGTYVFYFSFYPGFTGSFTASII